MRNFQISCPNCSKTQIVHGNKGEQFNQYCSGCRNVIDVKINEDISVTVRQLLNE